MLNLVQNLNLLKWEIGGGLHVLCISVAQGAGQAEWSTFPVHKVNVSDSREIKRHQKCVEVNSFTQQLS